MSRSFFQTVSAVIFALLALSACRTGFDTPYGSGRYNLTNTQCVPYARQVSGIQIYGDAYTWWEKAPPRYQRGQMPRAGAVLVLRNTARMRHGHLAVVRRVINTREIDVTHSNWGNDWNTRRIIYDSARVRDVSPRNDWSSVSFWNYQSKGFGAAYAAFGFIYP